MYRAKALGRNRVEVYGEVAREFPEHVVYIAIRDVTGESGGGATRNREDYSAHKISPHWTLTPSLLNV